MYSKHVEAWNKLIIKFSASSWLILINRLTPNNPYMGRNAPLTSKRCILYIYSTNIGTDYFKHVLYSPFFSVQNAVCFIMQTCLVSVLFTFYIQSVLKLKKNNSGAKGLINKRWIKSFCLYVRFLFYFSCTYQYPFCKLHSYVPCKSCCPTKTLMHYFLYILVS